MKDKKRQRKGDNWWWLLLVIDWLIKKVFVTGGRVQWNQGIAFGMFSSGGWGAGLILVIMAALVVWWVSLKENEVGERLIILGGMGNLVDRLVYGHVVDWLNLPLVGLWINLADLYICVGVGIILWEYVTNQRNIWKSSGKIAN